jgi:3-hydroxyisobutyrate dehydrogenase-like beta-hydroxyacid dehydrogenase
MKVGFVGVGQMGLPILENLVASGHAVTAYDRDATALARAARAGAGTAAGLASLAADCDTVLTALPAPKISEAVYLAADGLLAGVRDGEAGRDKVFIELSTVSPGLVHRLAQACAGVGASLLDCGMSGGPAGAASGDLCLMVGGPGDVFARTRALLDAIGRPVFHCGDTGTGMTAKLVNNALAHVNALAVCEAFALGAKNGMDPKVLYDVVTHSSGMSWVLPARFRQYIQEGTFNPGMSLDLLQKDSTLAMEMAHESGTPLFLLRIANSLFTWYQLEGMGPRNWAEMMTVWEDRLGVRIGAATSGPAGEGD